MDFRVLHKISGEFEEDFESVSKRFRTFQEISEWFPTVLGVFTDFYMNFKDISDGFNTSKEVTAAFHVVLERLRGGSQRFV